MIRMVISEEKVEPIPLELEGKKVLENVESVCPECFKEGKINKIDAWIVEEDGKVWIEKECKEHGFFRSIYFNDADLYHRWMKYKVTGRGVDNVEIESNWGPDIPQLYPKHLSQSILTNLMLTNRCNLRCSYCFMNAGAAGYVYEPSLEQLREMMRQARSEKPVPSKAIQLTGGEPTMREDLIEIIKMAREEGFVHVQLNTNGIKLSESVEYCKEIRKAGLNTVYMSFDGMSKGTNVWIEQCKKAVENLREVGLGIVLVPVAMGRNIHEVGAIVKYAAENIDVVRGVNFQPIAFAGRPQKVSDEYRLKERTDYVMLLEALEEQLDGQITKDDFFPVPSMYPVSKLVEKLKGEPQVEFTANPGCGGATYVFVQEDGTLVPITRFVDVEGLIEFIREQSEKSGMFKKARIALSLMKNIWKYIDQDKAPEELNIGELLLNALVRGNYDALGKFHMRSLFIGSMWFQDPWNLNLERLKRCVIHYSTPEGIVPFCAYNGLGVGEKIRERHSISVKKWEKETGRKMKDDLWRGGPISDLQ